MKRTPVKRKGGSRFPKRRDRRYMIWLLEQLKLGARCDGECGRPAEHRAHLIPKGSGGDDRLNVALLCGRCHERQEKRVQAYIDETGNDLFWKAARWDNLYTHETGRAPR